MKLGAVELQGSQKNPLNRGKIYGLYAMGQEELNE